jgi:serine/threonine-protein kinase
VAIKVIPSPADRGRDLGRRAQLEARVLCKLQHRNVVHVIDAGATPGGAVYLVMELLHGRTLRDAIRDYRRLGVAEVLSLGAQIADGVQAAHEQNTIHRDLKPENVFLREGNAIKVLDFGIAKFLGAGAATTQRDLLHGTILYMSPEHLQGLRVTARSDIYALGTTLYEALAGTPPCLVGMEEPTLESVTFAQINRMPLTLDVLTGTVPRFVARTIQRMIAKAPADRFATMAEVAQVLRANLERFSHEVPSGTAPPRKLWLGTHSIAPASGAIRSSDATTDVHQLAPTPTAPLADALQARNTATPLQFSLAPAIRTDVTAPMPRPKTAGPAPTTHPASVARDVAPLEASPDSSDTRRDPAGGERETPSAIARPPLTLPQFLLCGVALGTLIGVLVALVQTYPRPGAPVTKANISAARPSPATTSTASAITSSSVMPAGPSAATPKATPAPHAVSTPTSATAQQQAMVAAASAAAASAANSASAPARPHPLTRVVTKPASSQVSSGLLEPTDPVNAAKTSVAPSAKPSASPIRRPKAIYGSNDGAE